MCHWCCELSVQRVCGYLLDKFRVRVSIIDLEIVIFVAQLTVAQLVCRLDDWRRNEFGSGGRHQSGAKVGGQWSGAKRRKKILGVVPLHFFGYKSTISRFGERFRDGQHSLVSFCLLFFYSRCPRAQPFVKVGGGARAPSALWSRRHYREAVAVTVIAKHLQFFG